MAEKGIRTVWIDSDSVGVLGTKVYRDDVLIATVPFGTQFYNDPTAVVGVNYKYEVQAYNSTSESTDEVLGTNISYYTISDSTGLMPIMTSFRVEDATPNLVHFSTPLGSVSGIDHTDFLIEGKTITAVNTTDNYFTLSADIDYLDNILIRKEGGDNSVVYDFTLQEILNNLPEPVSTGDKYVEAGASGGDGSIGSPWGFVEGLTNVVAGETLWVKAGSYGAVNTTMSVSGTDINPIKVIGYKTTPGDITSMYYTYGRGVDLDPNEMPYFSGGGAAKCVDIQSDYVIWENLQFYNYYRSFVNEQGGVSDGVTGNIIKNCIGHTNSGGTNGNLLGFKGMTTSKCRVLDSICVNTNMLAFCFRVYNGMMKGNKAYADDLMASSDYYFDIKGGSNIIKDNLAHMTYQNTHAGHGFALKGRAADDSETYVWQTERNLLEDNTVINVEMGCQQSHKEVMYNVVRNHHHTMPDQFSTIKAYTFFNSSYNIVENGFADSDTGSCITWGVTGEDSAATEGAHNNIVKNTIFTRTTYAVRFTGDGEGTNKLSNNNQAINCTFDDVRYFTQNDDVNVLTGNKFVNCIFDGGVYELTQSGNPVNLSAEYVDFTNCGTWANAYIGNDGNFNEPPLLDANYEPQATFAYIDVPRIDGVYYGKNGNERQDPTTVGSILSAEEVPTDTPFEIISYNISEETDTTARVQVYMTEQCSINYYVDGVKNPASNDDFNAGNPEPGVYRHTRTLTELPPGQTSTLVIELTAQDDLEVVQSGNIPLTTLPGVQTETVYPLEVNDVLKNPGKGWIIYTQIESVAQETRDVASVYYGRWEWDQVHTADNTFDWSSIDQKIAHAAGNGLKFGFGIMPTVSGSGTPDWLFDTAGCAFYLSEHDGTSRVPVWDDPIFLAKQTQLVNALKDRYDGNTDVAYIDARTFGNWGEWNLVDVGGDFPADEVLISFIDIWNVFTETDIIAMNSGGETYAWMKGDAPYHGRDQYNFGWREDTVEWSTNWDSQNMPIWGDNQVGNVVSEYSSGYITLRDSGGYHGEFWNDDMVYEPILQSHYNYMGMGTWNTPGTEDADTFLAEKPDLIDWGQNHMGYWFRLTQATYPTDLGNGTSRTVTFSIRNDGVNRQHIFGKTGGVKIALLDASDNVLESNWLSGIDPRDWAPGQIISESASFSFASNPLGVKLALGFYSENTLTNPNTKIGTEREINNWYLITK